MIDDSFFDGLAAEMLSKWKRLRSFTAHNGSVGFHHEEILRETLRGMFSPRFQMRSGFVFTAKDNVSQQGDILVVDEAYPTPYAFRHGDLVVARPEAVSCVIEVKTRLSKRHFEAALNNLASFQNVADRAAPAHHPATFVFAFTGPKFTPKTLGDWYAGSQLEHAPKNYPTAVLVLDRGIVRFRGDPGFEKTGDYGHGVLIAPDSTPLSRSRSLAHFLAAIRSHVDLRAGIRGNAYNEISLDGVHIAAGTLRLGAGLVLSSGAAPETG